MGQTHRTETEVRRCCCSYMENGICCGKRTVTRLEMGKGAVVLRACVISTGNVSSSPGSGRLGAKKKEKLEMEGSSEWRGEKTPQPQ